MTGEQHRPPPHTVRDPAPQREEQDQGDHVEGEHDGDVHRVGADVLEHHGQDRDQDAEPHEVQEDRGEDDPGGDAAPILQARAHSAYTRAQADGEGEHPREAEGAEPPAAEVGRTRIGGAF